MGVLCHSCARVGKRGELGSASKLDGAISNVFFLPCFRFGSIRNFCVSFSCVSFGAGGHGGDGFSCLKGKSCG